MGDKVETDSMKAAVKVSSTNGKTPGKAFGKTPGKTLVGSKRPHTEGNGAPPRKVMKSAGPGQSTAFKQRKPFIRELSGCTDKPRSASKKKKDGKLKWFEVKRKDRKKMRQQQENKFYQLQLDAKKLWEKLRRSDMRSEEKQKVANELHRLVAGRVVDIIEAHDTSRVVECLYSNGSHEIKNSIFEEIKEKINYYAKSKYAKNVVLACLRYGSTTHREAIYKAVQTRVPDLFLHKEAAKVISVLYDDFCNSKKRAEMAQEFYSQELVYFKSEDAVTFRAAYEKCTERSTQENMLTNFRDRLSKLTDKGVIKYGLYHLLLYQLFEVLVDKAELLDMIRQVQHILVEILHTREGMQVALQCVWHSTAKERKIIAKSFKPFISKIATDNQGHKVLMGLLDVVDDTVMLNQTVISELMKNRDFLLKDKFGLKVLAYLIVGRDPRVINPETIDLLKRGDGNKNSKKDPEIRRKELRQLVQKTLIESICDNLEELITAGETSVVVRDIILSADAEFRINAMSRVLDLLKTPYEKGIEDHIIERRQGHFFIKKLLISDREKDKAEFSRLVMNQLGESVIRSWWKCNRGAFLCVSLIEAKDIDVKNWAKNALTKDRPEIAKQKNSKGAEILLERL
ncbi:pumilio protein-like [Tropilaelaps mercedesae]|uniref:Pumilio protein-like n=1 Tax=Tropilaelaps mercedesae TaxID=418985 RepID=A0A1V9XZ21_9ACAR|nr:pumilio protein-like [Tropilaelaps mercedesae]